jgi:cell division protein FtsL
MSELEKWFWTGVTVLFLLMVLLIVYANVAM